MCLQSVQIVQKRTFLEFVDLDDDDAGEYQLPMRRVRTEPAKKDSATDKLATAADQFSAVVRPCDSRSTGKSSVSTAVPSWADVTDDDDESVSSFASASACKPPGVWATSKGATGGAAGLKKKDMRTTLMLCNLPNDYDRDIFLDMLDGECLAGEYDFVYFPVDFHTGSGLGYAFVNFTSHEEALRAWKLFDGFKDWSLPSTKVCEVRWSTPVQGFKANVQRYRNSPLMHHKVPDWYKPMVFSNGVRTEYPAPKKPIKYMPDKKPSKHRK